MDYNSNNTRNSVSNNVNNTVNNNVGNSNGILVAVRIRPLNNKEIDCGIKSCVKAISDSIVVIEKEGDGTNYLKSQMNSLTEYQFDKVYNEFSTQQDVYNGTAKLYITNFINGQNVTVFAYGATGAGKSHTMLGNTRADSAANNADNGIIPNAVKDVFTELNNKKKLMKYKENYEIIVNFIEVYNEQVYDLLEPTGKVLSVREDPERGVVVVAGVTEQKVDSLKEVMDCLSFGNKNRKTEATLANAVSSRSHAVLQVILRHTLLNDNGKETLIESKLSLIDLAGSERASATNNRGVRLFEGANINKSLLALANCINALAGNNSNTSSLTSSTSTNTSTGAIKKLNVKYRDSKLTHLLKSSLEGNCNLIMIANINPSNLTYEDSHNTLKYANRAKNIKVDPVVKESVKESNWVEREKRLIAENSMLKERIVELENIIIELQADHEFKGDHRSKDVNTSLSSIMSTSESSSIGIKSPSYMESSREEEAIHNAVSKKNASTFGNKRSKLAAIVSSAISSVNETLIDTTDVADSTTFSIKPAASKIVAASVEIVKPRLTRKSIQTPTITKASRVSARRNSVAPISKTAVEVEQKIPEEIESAVGRKRRQSFLPTTRGKKVFTGHVEKALLIDEGIVLEKDSMPVLKQAITPVKEASNPFADVLRSEKKQKMVESDKIILSVEESAETNALYSFEVGSDQKEKVIPTRIRRQRVSITRSSDAGGRRKSMAAVTAMLDSLNVKHSSTVDAIPGSVESNNDQDDLDNTNNDNPDDDEENTSVFSTVRVTRSMRSSSSAHLLDGLPAKQLTKKRKSQIVIEPIEENENADCNTSKTTKTCKVSKKKTVVADGNHNLKERKNIYVEETENYQHKWIDI